MNAVEATDLTKRYPGGVSGLDEVTVSIAEGEFVGILGPSGAGKTTFFRLLNGAIRPTSGALSILGSPTDGQTGNGLRALRQRIAFIYQSHQLVPNLSVAHNVLAGRLGRRSLAATLRSLFYLSSEEVRTAHRALEKVGIADKILARVEDLSGGQQQRVAVARALVQDAALILADEPIASVDSATAADILDLLRALNEERGKTIIMALHQRDFALRYCQRLLVFEKGRLVMDGPPERLEEHNSSEAEVSHA